MQGVKSKYVPQLLFDRAVFRHVFGTVPVRCGVDFCDLVNSESGVKVSGQLLQSLIAGSIKSKHTNHSRDRRPTPQKQTNPTTVKYHVCRDCW